MAKLKIPDNSDPLKPSIRGYINVVDNLVLIDANYQAFLRNSNMATRPTKLQEYAGADENGKCVVTHLPMAGAVEPITDGNCLIQVHVDERQGGSAPKSRHNMSVPDVRPSSVDYLDAYAKIIHDLYATGPQGRIEASKYLFGIMLLTRCR